VTVSGFSITGSDAGNYTLNSPFTLTASITEADQAITFGSLMDKTYGDADFSLSGSADSGLTVTFISDTLTICTVSGTTMSLAGVGTCTITASQGGDANYYAATDVQQSFSVNQKTLTVTGLSAENKTYDGTTSATLSGTASLSGVVGSDDVSLSGSASGTFSDSTVGTDKEVTVSGLSIIGSDTGYYTFDSPFTLTASIIQADQSISFIALAEKNFGDADFNLTGSSDSGLTVSFTSGTLSICTVSGTTVSLVSPGICSITASQAGDENYNAAADVTQSFNVRAIVTPTAGLNGSINPAVEQAVIVGDTYTFTITPTNGYYVETPISGSCGGSYTGDVSDGVNGIRYTTDAVTGNCTVEPSFAGITHQLSITVNGEGTVSGDTGGIDCPGTCTDWYDLDTVVTMTATPDAGKQFLGWSGDEDCSDGEVTITTDISCTAEFYSFPWEMFIPAMIGIGSSVP